MLTIMFVDLMHLLSEHKLHLDDRATKGPAVDGNFRSTTVCARSRTSNPPLCSLSFHSEVLTSTHGEKSEGITNLGGIPTAIRVLAKFKPQLWFMGCEKGDVWLLTVVALALHRFCKCPALSAS